MIDEAELQAVISELEAEAGERFNVYYVAYAKATGAESPKAAFERDGGNHLFFEWNNARWAETKRRLGLPVNELFPHLVVDHIRTLAMHLIEVRHG